MNAQLLSKPKKRTVQKEKNSGRSKYSNEQRLLDSLNEIAVNGIIDSNVVKPGHPIWESIASQINGIYASSYRKYLFVYHPIDFITKVAHLKYSPLEPTAKEQLEAHQKELASFSKELHGQEEADPSAPELANDDMFSGFNSPIIPDLDNF